MESEPTPSPDVPAEPEPLPDREDVIFDVLAVCIAIGLVLLAIAVRANMKRERLRNMAKKKGSAEVRERVAPAKADLEAVEALAGVEGLTAAAALEARRLREERPEHAQLVAGHRSWLARRGVDARGPHLRHHDVVELLEPQVRRLLLLRWGCAVAMTRCRSEDARAVALRASVRGPARPDG